MLLGLIGKIGQDVQIHAMEESKEELEFVILEILEQIAELMDREAWKQNHAINKLVLVKIDCWIYLCIFQKINYLYMSLSSYFSI